MGVIYVFGDFELDADRFELRRAQQELDVQPKVLRLLLHLIEHRERSVSSDELLRELWPGTSVEAGSLKRAILGVRQALGERATGPSSVRTVRGHGYQFVREVTERDTAARARTKEVEPDQPTAPASGRAGSRNPFLGRERVLELLLADLGAALRGQSCCVLLTGEPGIGKSRLAEVLWARAREQGAETWLGRCAEGEGVPAFWPFVLAFREAMRQRGPDRIRELMAQAGPDVARAMDELQAEPVEASASGPPEARSARFRMFDSVGRFLRQAAEQRPIVLGFDDLHLADAATLQLLSFLVKQAYAAPLLIVGTFRRDSGAASQLLAALAVDERTRCIELRGLASDDLARYLELAIGESPPAFFVDALYGQTAGNPLFVRQLVESWRALAVPGDWEALLRSSSGYGLHGAIERHLQCVSGECRQLLRAAAVLGRDFSEALCAEVSELALDAARAQLAAAEAAGIVEPPPERDRRCFSHGLVRDALYEQLPAAERARLHGLAGRALERRLIGLDYARLAEVTRHFVLAAPAHDAGRALHYTQRAAETALARFAYEEAAAHLQTALQLCDSEPPDPARRMRLSFRLGDTLRRSADFEAARHALLEALSLASELGDAEILSKAALSLVWLPDDSSVDAAKLSALRAALKAAQPDGLSLACVQASLAKALAYSADRVERVALARAALQQAASFEDLHLRSDVMVRCHEALVDPEHLHERVAIAAELLQLAYRQDDPGALLRASSAQIETCIERGDVSGALDATARMESLAEQLREPFFRWHAQLVRAMHALVSGQPALAERRAEAARAYASPFFAEGAHHVFAVQVTGVYAFQGRLREAERLVHEIALRYPGLPGWDARVGCIDWNLGRRDEARARLARLMDRGLSWIRREPYALSGLCSVAELCGLTRDASAARALYGELAPYAAHYGVTALGAASYGPVTYYLGVLSACAGELARAQTHFVHAYESATKIQSPTYRAMIGATHALLLAYMGQREDRERAAEMLRDALAIARRCELHALSRRCVELAGQHDLDLAERGAGRQPARS